MDDEDVLARKEVVVKIDDGVVIDGEAKSTGELVSLGSTVTLVIAEASETTPTEQPTPTPTVVPTATPTLKTQRSHIPAAPLMFITAAA